jgi:hypothetical protein
VVVFDDDEISHIVGFRLHLSELGGLGFGILGGIGVDDGEFYLCSCARLNRQMFSSSSSSPSFRESI